MRIRFLQKLSSRDIHVFGAAPNRSQQAADLITLQGRSSEHASTADEEFAFGRVGVSVSGSSMQETSAARRRTP
jgi:hypothetical protein